MPQRVSDADVKEIFPTTLNTQPFILAASAMVDHYLAQAAMSSALLREIERWLAAHLACAADPRLVEAGTDGDRLKYASGTLGTGLSSTPYGQAVLSMDTSGILAATTTTKRAKVMLY